MSQFNTRLKPSDLVFVKRETATESEERNRAARGAAIEHHKLRSKATEPYQVFAVTISTITIMRDGIADNVSKYRVVQPSIVLDNPVSTDTKADQSAMDGAELSANRQNISDIRDGPEPSRTFPRMRKSRSIHYAFDKIVDHDLTGTQPVYKIR